MRIVDRARSLLMRAHRIRASRSRQDWESEYGNSTWGLLSDLTEMGRYWVATGYCARTFQRPSILDVGCGTGLMEEKLRLLPYSRYLGIDFSLNALLQFRNSRDYTPRLVCADLNDFWVTEKFDAIVFMEAFEADMPIPQTLERYCAFLRPKGRLILSMYDGENKTATTRMWGKIRESFKVEDATQVENLPTQKSWKIALLAP